MSYTVIRSEIKGRSKRTVILASDGHHYLVSWTYTCEGNETIILPCDEVGEPLHWDEIVLVKTTEGPALDAFVKIPVDVLAKKRVRQNIWVGDVP